MTTNDYKRLRVTITYYEPDYEWLQVTTSDYKGRDYEPDYEWLWVTTGHYKWLRASLRVTTSDYKWLQAITSQATNDYNLDWQ